jgi:outer membrane protein OmpA-like peptidoglycan-associated protein
MRSSVLLPLAAAALACAGDRAAAPAPVAAGDVAVLRAAELARVRCLVVAPFENGSDAPLASEIATSALVSELDPARVRVFPVQELRALFRDTPLDLPAGMGPSLALELAELLGADAVLYGSVEGHSRGELAPELLVNVRLSLVAEHRLLFARTVLVSPPTRERTDSTVRRAVVAASRSALARLGDLGRKRCFDADRTRSLRKLALAQAAEAKAAADAACAPAARAAAAPAPPPPAASAPPAAPVPVAAARATPPPAPASPSAPAPPPARASLRTPRQTEWAKRLKGGERFVVEDVSFAGRSDDLQRDVGLADLAVALLAEPAVSVRVEGFVDATSDPAADRRLAASMAQAAAKELADLGVPRQRVTALGRGGDSPRLPNFTARGRAANRRIEAVPLR